MARLVKISWDEECNYDLITGRGFEVTEPALKKVKGKDEKSKYGIQSPLFCSDWGDDDAFAERYRCDCGETIGRIFNGEICPTCGTEVRYKDVDISFTGWIILHNHFIIQPIFHNMLTSIIGTRQFNEITKFDKHMTRDGHLEQKDHDHPFYGIGLIEFKERFDEIIEYYKKKKKDKIELIEDIEENRDRIFAHCIPVYSSVLRPTLFKGENLFYSTIDRTYNSIFSSVRLLNDNKLFEERRKKWKKEKKERMDIPTILNTVQDKVNDLYQLVFQLINGKEGFIRSEILGGMINFTARNVIIPDPHLKADEVIVNYMTFLELYKYEIIAAICKVYNVATSEAYEQWFKARIKYSPKIHELMNYLLKKQTRYILVNRNP